MRRPQEVSSFRNIIDQSEILQPVLTGGWSREDKAD